MAKSPEISLKKKSSFTAAKSAAQVDLKRMRGNLPKPPDLTALSNAIDRQIAQRKKAEDDLDAVKKQIDHLTYLLASAQGSKSIGKSGKLKDDEIFESAIFKRTKKEIDNIKKANEDYKLSIQRQIDTLQADIKSISKLLKEKLIESNLSKPRTEFYNRKIKALEVDGLSALQDLFLHMYFSPTND
jgi:hypothetical protein